MVIERVDYRVEEHYRFDAGYPRLSARYRVEELYKELLLFAFLPNAYSSNDIKRGLKQLDRAAQAGVEIAIQAIANEREACATLEPMPRTPEEWDELDDEWTYRHGCNYRVAFRAGWEAYRDAIRARAGIAPLSMSDKGTYET